MSDLHLPVPLQNAATDTQRADQLLTVADVAGRIGAHEQTVRHWIKSGELKAARFGTRIGYRIRLGDSEEFLRRRTLTGAIAAQLLQGAATAPDA
jgi:excisionase family DNA binding protein